MIWEVFDLITKQSIGFVKAGSYERACEDAYLKYNRPVDICFHDKYTEEYYGRV